MKGERAKTFFDELVLNLVKIGFILALFFLVFFSGVALGKFGFSGFREFFSNPGNLRAQIFFDLLFKQQGEPESTKEDGLKPNGGLEKNNNEKEKHPVVGIQENKKENSLEKDEKKILIDTAGKINKEIKEEDLELLEVQEQLDDVSEEIDVFSQKVASLSLSVKRKEEVGEKEIGKEEQESKKEKLNQEENQPEFFVKTKKEKPEREKGVFSKGGKKFTRYFRGGGQKNKKEKEEPNYCQKPLINDEENFVPRTLVINEIAWMGTNFSSNDEWIEIKNISDDPVNLLSWQLIDKDEQIKIIFPSITVSPQNFLLLERTNDESVPDISADLIYRGALNDENESLYLFDSSCQLQDFVLAVPDWPYGDKEEKRTMERGDDFSWHTFSGEGSQGIMGTPKAENSQPLTGVPILELEPKSLEFSVLTTDSKNLSQFFNIYNSGEGELDWQAAIEYVSPSSGLSWLEINPSFGSDSAQVSVLIDISDLQEGEYSAKITVEAEGARNNPQEVEVSLIVSQPVLSDQLAPEVIFFLDEFQKELVFSVPFEINDIAQEGVSPSGLAGFNFRWKEENDEDWEELGYEEIEGSPISYSSEKEFIGQDKKRYYFQIKAKDEEGNESIWLYDSPVFTTIVLAKDILINEIQIDSLEGTGGTEDDWVELYNPNDYDFSFDGWSIQKHSKDEPCSLSKGFYKKNFDKEAIIPKKGFFLIVGTKAREELKEIADMTIGWSLTQDNTIYLVKDTEKIESGEDKDIADKVGFGDSCFPEGESAIEPAEGKSIERKELGLDTDNNKNDFKINENPSPTNSKNKSFSFD